ncbi:hypothetical protein FIBSPDRAFT_940647 [Athelia psychrophila]|uniref:F-box domain-containing protein n=1 Tax=Athelia psychrophila TaxID=1759441 RepID=A0A167VL24_9AGAM|nr:hypothetical protein FIBSPDRAFT_940647 [Fibularhizoctonia sp. CBS 109695]
MCKIRERRSIDSDPLIRTTTALLLPFSHPMKCGHCNKLDLVFDHGPVIPYPPPCENLLLSHTVPSPLDQNDIKLFIADIIGRLSRLEKYTKRLGALARELEVAKRRCAEERSILDKALLEYQSVVTPIRMIPDDVLREIFTAVPFWPFHLAGVCRRWRAVAISTPRLWTHLTKIGSPDRSDLVEKANLMRIVANRSGVCPMQIRLKMHIASPEGWGEEEEKMMLVTAIANSAGRWQTLELGCSRGCLVKLQRVLHANHSQLFETLQSLCIVVDDSNAEPLSIFACAPRLKRVTFSGPSALGLELPWGQIENLTLVISPSSMRFLVATLAQCHNLVHGDFYFHNGYAYHDSEVHPSNNLVPVRNNMQSCKFGVHAQGIFQAFFDGLELPSLSTLHIDADRGRGIWSHSSFSRFLHRSNCTLQKLTLELAELSTPALLQLLASVPSLEEFVYYHGILNRIIGPDPEAPTLDNDILRQLTHTSGTGTCPTGPSLLLPNLRILKLIDPNFRIDLNAFVVMLMSRTALPPARRLDQLHLHYRNNDEIKFLESALARTGLKIYAARLIQGATVEHAEIYHACQGRHCAEELHMLVAYWQRGV